MPTEVLVGGIIFGVVGAWAIFMTFAVWFARHPKQ